MSAGDPHEFFGSDSDEEYLRVDVGRMLVEREQDRKEARKLHEEHKKDLEREAAIGTEVTSHRRRIGVGRGRGARARVKETNVNRESSNLMQLSSCITSK